MRGENTDLQNLLDANIGEIVETGKKKQKRTIAMMLFAFGLMAFCVAVYFLSVKFIIPESKYRAAEEKLAMGAYEEASAAFQSLGSYKDAQERAKEAYFMKGLALLDEKEYDAAFLTLQQVQEVGWDREKINSSVYDKALDLFEKGDYMSAATLFQRLAQQGNYLDTQTRLLDAYYHEGLKRVSQKEYDAAIDAFAAAGSYEDSKEQKAAAYYEKASEAFANGQYKEAIDAFACAGSYGDAETQIAGSYYALAEQQFANREYAEAIISFRMSKDYKDAEKRLDEAQLACYDEAVKKAEAEEYKAALPFFELLKDYKNSADYAMSLKLLTTRFDDGAEYNLRACYADIHKSSVPESIKNELLDMPQMKTVVLLNGTWRAERMNQIENGKKIYLTLYCNNGKITQEAGTNNSGTGDLCYSKQDGYFADIRWHHSIKEISADSFIYVAIGYDWRWDFGVIDYIVYKVN